MSTQPVTSAPVPVAVEGGGIFPLHEVLRRRLEIKVIPFTKSTTERDTGWRLPNGAIVWYVFVEVTASASSSSISVGLKSSESGGNASGFLSSLPCTSTGFVFPSQTSTSSGGQSLGSYLRGTEIKSADTTAIYFVPLKPFASSSVTAKTVTYTTSNHDIAGRIWIVYTVV